jgi:hypothetical protein
MPNPMINIKRSDYLALMRVSLPMFIEWVFTEVNPSTPYLDNFHIPLIAGYLEKMRLDDLRRLIINIPPRNLKSIIVSVAYVAWLMGHDPTCKIICVSYAQDLADFLARMCRLVMMSPRYHEMFPQTRISPFRTAASGFETTLGGYRFATSLDGPLLGFGADYIIIDDIVNAQEVLSAQTTLIANGAVFIPKEAPWRDEFIQELIAFPRGRYNDQVDSVSQALKWIGAQDVERAITTFYRMQVEARRGPVDGDEIVFMECMNKSVNVVYLVNGDQLRIGSDGFFRVPKRYSGGMLADWRAKWRLVDDT